VSVGRAAILHNGVIVLEVYRRAV